MAVAIAATQQQNSDGGSLSRDLTSSEPSIPLCLAQFALTQSPPRKLHLLSVQLPLVITSSNLSQIWKKVYEDEVEDKDEEDEEKREGDVELHNGGEGSGGGGGRKGGEGREGGKGGGKGGGGGEGGD
ncbi:hypothetical protein HZH66_008539 [Vespula vulgaris]|uniref:Uncharacterized protein n=1 Tax=Vespula vulgaris TaxID=7454 RepID=A0A834JQJ4_VESVU|nr:hypothetical protein HZH66_008539 [Vespula vulgaris]